MESLSISSIEPEAPIEIDVQDIDPLEIIASIVDKIGIVEIINKLTSSNWTSTSRLLD